MSTILHVADYFPEYGGNFIASLSQLRETCRKQGWDMVVVFPEAARHTSWCNRLVEKNWRIHFLPRDVSRARCAWILAKLISRERAALIHTHFVQYDLVAWLAARLAGRGGKRVRVVWHIHSELNVPLTPIRRITNFIKYRLMGRSAWMIPVGYSVAKGALAAGCPESRIRTVENGVDLAHATAATKERLQVLADLGIEESDRLILMFGWDAVRKGVDIAFDAVAKLVEQKRQVVLGIVGGQGLQKYVYERAGSQLPSWLRVLTPVENVGDLYREAAVFLSASRSEGLPYSVCEAMAACLPIILSDIPSLLWAHRSTGAVFFPSGDSVALAAALCRVLDWNAEEREQHTAANEQFIKTEFSVSLWADRILLLYREILGQNKNSSPASSLGH